MNNKIKFQVALDDLSLSEAFDLIEKKKKWVDIIEIGTPLIYREGLHAVRKMKDRFPEKEILADLKIIDAGYYEASEAFSAGADLVTVLALADNNTIVACALAAKDYQKKIFADLICVDNHLGRIAALEELGLDGICIHTGVDQQKQGKTPLEGLQTIANSRTNMQIAIAGGISSKNCSDIALLKPDIVIVGGSIAHAEDAEAESSRISEILRS